MAHTPNILPTDRGSDSVGGIDYAKWSWYFFCGLILLTIYGAFALPLMASGPAIFGVYTVGFVYGTRFAIIMMSV